MKVWIMDTSNNIINLLQDHSMDYLRVNESICFKIVPKWNLMIETMLIEELKISLISVGLGAVASNRIRIPYGIEIFTAKRRYVDAEHFFSQ